MPHIQEMHREAPAAQQRFHAVLEALGMARPLHIHMLSSSPEVFKDFVAQVGEGMAASSDGCAVSKAACASYLEEIAAFAKEEVEAAARRRRRRRALRGWVRGWRGAWVAGQGIG